MVEGVKKVAKVTNFTTALKVIGTVENGFTSINNTVGKLQNAIIQKVGTGANLTAKLIVNGSTELLSYSRKVINVPASRWITSTSGWTYVSSIAGDYIDQTGKKVKGYLKIYKRNCLTGNSIATNANARVQASTTGNNCDFGVSGISESIKDFFKLGSRKKGKSNRNPDIDKPRNTTDFLEADANYFIDGFKYTTNEKGLVKEVNIDDLELNNGFRERELNYQEQIAFQDKKDYDDGGHLIANWFRGPNEAINIVPMRKSLNRNVTDPTIIDPTGKGAWLAMEREWANALKADKKVSVKIEVKYSNDRRPTNFVVTYTIAGKEIIKSFKN